MSKIRTTTAPAEALAIVAICFGVPIATSINAMFSGFGGGSFSNSAFVNLIVMEVVMAFAAITILKVRGYACGSLYPNPSWSSIAIGLVLYVLAELAGGVAVLPFAADFGAQPISFMLENATVSLSMVVPMAMVNGTYEEVFLLAFLARGLRRYGTSTAVGVSLLVRVLYHLYQGPVGAVSVLVFGGILSVFYLRTGSLFPAVFAHILADIVPFV